TVASAAKLNNTIGADIREHDVVILDFSDTLYVDDSAALVVEQLIDTAMKHDVRCIIVGLKGIPETTLRALNVLRNVPPEHFKSNLEDASILARKLLS
ncbi:MAG: STAS domain-containing protein, partial [Dehalococcoidia bacterium]|nr:STAS domain-containing protein [Dehalococcoidia bacterium]